LWWKFEGLHFCFPSQIICASNTCW
jgi:hypothetical protein